MCEYLALLQVNFQIYHVSKIIRLPKLACASFAEFESTPIKLKEHK
jgi:hypothetical protein